MISCMKLTSSSKHETINLSKDKINDRNWTMENNAKREAAMRSHSIRLVHSTIEIRESLRKVLGTSVADISRVCLQVTMREGSLCSLP